jgi:hypothetical protein
MKQKFKSFIHSTNEQGERACVWFLLISKMLHDNNVHENFIIVANFDKMISDFFLNL